MIDSFFKILGGTIIALIMYLCLNKQSKEFSALLSVITCAVIGLGVMLFIRPVLDFADRLCATGDLEPTHVRILVKITGICILTEIVSGICADTGNATWAKLLHMMGALVIFWIAIPVFDMVLTLLESLLGEI